ncbi:MAG: trehalose-phosphatase [Acidobacteriota bacterium]
MSEPKDPAGPRRPVVPRDPAALPSALEERDEIAALLGDRRPAVFLDYDGTLTPIVSRPELAALSERMRRVLRELASRLPVAIVSGRDRADVARLVGLREMIYAGSHGFDIAGPGGLAMEHEEAGKCLPDLEAAEEVLRRELREIPASQVERKRFGLAAHYRNVAEELVPAVERAVDRALAGHGRLEKRGGKEVFELRPRLDWDKGKAVLWLLRALGLDAAGILPIFVGDDLTDEDAFLALADRGVGILVGRPGHRTFATYSLRDSGEVGLFLDELAGLAARKAR